MIVDELLLHVEIANAAGGTAKLAELAKRLCGFIAERWKALETVEKIEVGFDAAAFGTQLVDGMRRGTFFTMSPS